jgi:hypothetical protein
MYLHLLISGKKNPDHEKLYAKYYDVKENACTWGITYAQGRSDSCSRAKLRILPMPLSLKIKGG